MYVLSTAEAYCVASAHVQQKLPRCPGLPSARRTRSPSLASLALPEAESNLAFASLEAWELYHNPWLQVLLGICCLRWGPKSSVAVIPRGPRGHKNVRIPQTMVSGLVLGLRTRMSDPHVPLINPKGPSIQLSSTCSKP